MQPTTEESGPAPAIIDWPERHVEYELSEHARPFAAAEGVLADASEPGSTVKLTDEGWEDTSFVEPDDDWTLLADGSYLSRDGAWRTWPLAGTEPA